MERFIKPVISITFVSLLSACAHHNNVRPASDGNHYVKLSAQTRDAGGKEAWRQAKLYCSEQKASAYVNHESIDYTGSLPESEYLSNLNIANAVETAGTVLWVLGENKVDDVGAAMSIGGGIAEDSMGTPYQVELSFTCR